MNLGGVLLNYALCYEETQKWFRWHMVSSTEEIKDPVSLTYDIIRERRNSFSPGVSDSFVEFRILVEPTGKKLCEYGVFIMHAVAFLWNGCAWLLTAPSGTGKTTQYLNWKKLFPEEVSMICGDMPILKAESDGKIMVYPSPWNGKERMGFENHNSYPLGGIIYLMQADHNRFEKADFRELILPLWIQFVGIPDTETQIRSKEHFANILFSRYPVWKYENMGDEASTLKMRKALSEYHVLDEAGS